MRANATREGRTHGESTNSNATRAPVPSLDRLPNRGATSSNKRVSVRVSFSRPRHTSSRLWRERPCLVAAVRQLQLSSLHSTIDCKAA
eukprot:2121988-Prymnesium_polylepis.1